MTAEDDVEIEVDDVVAIVHEYSEVGHVDTVYLRKLLSTGGLGEMKFKVGTLGILESMVSVIRVPRLDGKPLVDAFIFSHPIKIYVMSAARAKKFGLPVPVEGEQIMITESIRKRVKVI